MINFRSPIAVGLVILGVLVTLAGFVLIPSGVGLPTHWGLDGQVNGTQPKLIALLQMPGAVALVWGIFFAMSRWGSTSRHAGQTTLLNIVLPAITGLLVLVQLLIVLVGLGVPINFLGR